MADTILQNKLQFFERENKLLMAQQQNYKELCTILSQRHVEIIKYLNHLKNLIEKVLFFTKENLLDCNYFNDKNSYENNILNYDKKIQTITEAIQSSHARISDSEGLWFQENLKLLSSSLVNFPNHQQNNKPNSDQQTLMNVSSSSSAAASTSASAASNYNSELATNSNATSSGDDNSNKVLNNSTGGGGDDDLFEPKLQLEVLDYNDSNNYNQNINNNNNNNNNPLLPKPIIKQNGYLKTAACEYCGKFFNLHYLQSHKRVHTGARPYRCTIPGCNRSFTQTSSRNIHEKRVHNSFNNSLHHNNNNNNNSKFIPDTKFRCNYPNCDVSLDLFEDMQKHVQQHQVLLNTVVNSHHQASFIQQPANQNEIIPQNTVPRRGRKPLNYVSIPGTNGPCSLVSNNRTSRHPCPYCGKGFDHKVALKQHMVTHGPKNFPCSFNGCNYASYWKHNLALHMRKHHQESK